LILLLDPAQNRIAQGLGSPLLGYRHGKNGRSILQFADEGYQLRIGGEDAFESGELVPLKQAQHVERGQFLSFLRVHA
jgi:hypothetical protein